MRLFKRCVQCPPITPSCNCASGQTCSLFPADCNNCQFTQCSGTATNSGPPVAAIAGGVVGGVFVLAIIVFLAYWFRRKRHIEYPADDDQYETEEWQQMQMQQEKDEHDRYSSRMANRMSTRTVASTSSAATGRTSNIIQIAYIPGVTNRSQSTPDLVPPVPPIPAASGGSSRMSHGLSSRASQADQLLFRPDLRGSTYSGYSERESLAASRTSFASTAYRSDAIVNPMPAQAVNLLKPTPVSVKTGSKDSPTISRTDSPPPGSSSSSQHQLNTKSSIVGKFAQPRTITVTRKPSNSLKPHGFKAFELDGSDRSVSSTATSLHQRSGPASPGSNAASTFDYGSEEDDANTHLVELPANRRTMTSSIVPLNENPVELSDSSRHSSIPRAIQDSMMKAMQINMGPAPETSPFSDAHELRTPTP